MTKCQSSQNRFVQAALTAAALAFALTVLPGTALGNPGAACTAFRYEKSHPPVRGWLFVFLAAVLRSLGSASALP